MASETCKYIFLPSEKRNEACRIQVYPLAVKRIKDLITHLCSLPLSSFVFTMCYGNE